MNELTAAAIAADNDQRRTTDQSIRNARRRIRWANRYMEKFGRYPESYDPQSVIDQTRSSISEIDINAKANAARMAVCFSEDLIAPRQGAEIFVHPAMFERHGNQGVRKIKRHRRQLGGRMPEPPEAA